MTVGWGLRGSIGGGPVGAMIPGALVAMSLCMVLHPRQPNCALATAFGAVGVGFGGQMTYGQTVGFIIDPASYTWGLAGLTLKGAIWGLVGGAVLGIALAGARSRRSSLLPGLVLMVAGTYLGWKLLNEPKLLYFSNPVDKPRPEIWAGLLLGGILFLGWLARLGMGKIPLRFALAGALGGGIGFGAGGTIMAIGLTLPVDQSWYPWWSLMEFTLGFCFGLALGICAWRNRTELDRRDDLAEQEVRRQPAWMVPWMVPVLTAVLVAVAFLAGPSLHSRFSYTIVGVVLLAIALYSDSLAWQIAITLTTAGFALDLTEVFPFSGNPVLVWGFTGIASLAVCVLILRRHFAGRPMLPWTFLLLLWTALAVALVRAILQSRHTGAVLVHELAFIAGTLLVTWMISRWRVAIGKP